MADEPTSNLPDAATLDGTELLAVVQSGDDRKATVASFVNYLASQLVNFGPITAGANVVDQVLVDDVAAVQWFVQVQDATPGANRDSLTIEAHHDGHTADATDAFYTTYGGSPAGTVPVTWSVDVAGSGASQYMRLIATVTGGATWEGQVQRRPLAT